MKPLICFYKNQWIWSENYLKLDKPKTIQTLDFLKSIELNYFNQLKIIQADFDAFQATSSAKFKYYRSPVVQVYVLKEFNLSFQMVLQFQIPWFLKGILQKNYFVIRFKK